MEKPEDINDGNEEELKELERLTVELLKCLFLSSSKGLIKPKRDDTETNRKKLEELLRNNEDKST